MPHNRGNCKNEFYENVLILFAGYTLSVNSLLKAQASESWGHVFRSNSEFCDPWEVRFADISLHNIIGEGTFGTVYRGALSKQPLQLGNGKKPTQLTVAVKMLQCTICLYL